jgi:hypothetical protein
MTASMLPRASTPTTILRPSSWTDLILCTPDGK